MKKLFTLLSLCLCGWVAQVQAQTLTFQLDGQDIENGATVYSSTVDEELLHMGDNLGLPQLNNLKFIPDITITSTVDAENVHVALESLDNPQVELELCSFDGTCVASVASEKTGRLSANEAEDMQIHSSAMRPADQIVTIRARVSAWYEGQEANKVSFTLVMTNDETVLGVDAVRQSSSASVTMSGNVMQYALPDAGAHTLRIYNVDGARIMSQALRGSEGQVSLSSLRKGIYIWQIAGQAGASQGKFIVK